MRMWHPRLVPYMCRKHLLGQHVELHMILGSMRKQKNLDGFLNKKIIFPINVEPMHNDVVVPEMVKRGYKHKSDMSFNYAENINENYYKYFFRYYKVNEPFEIYERDLQDLAGRCEECKANLTKGGLL